jgi:hypothetical protein
VGIFGPALVFVFLFFSRCHPEPALGVRDLLVLLHFLLFLPSPFPPSQISNLKSQISAAVDVAAAFTFAFAFSPQALPPQNPVQDPTQRHCSASTNGDDPSKRRR